MFDNRHNISIGILVNNVHKALIEGIGSCCKFTPGVDLMEQGSRHTTPAPSPPPTPAQGHRVNLNRFCANIFFFDLVHAHVRANDAKTFGALLSVPHYSVPPRRRVLHAKFLVRYYVIDILLFTFYSRTQKLSVM